MEVTFDNFIYEMEKLYAEYTPEFAESESGVKAETIIETARLIGGPELDSLVITGVRRVAAISAVGPSRDACIS